MVEKKALTLFSQIVRGVAQLAARHVRDVEVGSSSLLTPTNDSCVSQDTAIVLLYIKNERNEQFDAKNLNLLSFVKKNLLLL